MKKRYIPLIVAIISIIFSARTSLGGIGGIGQKEISDKYFTLITPASFTFSIWTLIYITSIIVAIFIAMKKIKVDLYQKLLFSWILLISSVWLIPWQLDMIGPSFWVILILFFFTLEFFIKSRKESFLLCFISELFMGWILVATVANLAVFLTSTGNILNLSQVLIFLIFIFIIDILFLLKYKALTPAIIFVWTSFGIYTEQSDIILKKSLLTLSFVIILLLLREIFTPKLSWKTKK